MDQPAAQPRRRAAAPDPDAYSSPPPPPHRHRHRLRVPYARPPPPPPPPSLPLSWALLPPKKRPVLCPPRNAATPISPSPPPPPQSSTHPTPVPSAETLILPAPTPPPPVADSELLPPPPPPPPPPVSEEDAAPCAQPIPCADPRQPSTPPPAPDASTKPAPPARKVRKVVRKVIVKKIVPKGTFAARKAAAAAAAAAVASDGAANLTGESATDKPADDHCVATDDSVSKEQSKIVLAHRPVTNCNAFTGTGSSALDGETPNSNPKSDEHATADNLVDKVQDADERVVEESATDCTAVVVQAAGETPTEKPTEDDDQGILAAKSARKEQNVNETTVEKLATDCNDVATREASCKEAAVGSLIGQTLARKPTIDCDAEVGEQVGISERQRTSMKEVFVGGLHRDATEEDVRAVFRKAGEITQVRMIMEGRTRRNKGYCFVRYREAAQAKNAIAKFGNVKICGKFCRTAAPVGNDRTSLGNINKGKKEDVKSIFVEEIPSSWDQAKLTEIFQNYGKIEHIFLSRNTKSSKKRACACIKYMTHEAAVFCVESFDKEELTENGSKVNIKVSLSKPVQRSELNKEEHTFLFSENDKTLAPIQVNRTTYSGEKRPCSTLDGCSSDRMRSHSHPRHGSSTSTTSTLSDNVLASRSPLPSLHGTNRFPAYLGSYNGVARSSIRSQIRQVGAHQLLHPYGRWTFQKI